MRLFLDANVLFSAAWSSGSRLEILFALADAGLCVLTSSAFAIDEAQRNLATKRPESLQRLAELLVLVERVPEAAASECRWAVEQGLPPKDAPILAAARQAGADVLLTGDATHFGHLYDSPVGGMRILRPADALALLLDATE